MVGRATVHALLAAGDEVRAVVDPLDVAAGTVDALRARGVKTALGTLDDEAQIELACEQVHTVVHGAADLLQPPDDVLDDIATVLSAALGANAKRFVLASHQGADSPGDNAWLAAMAEAEAMLSDAPIDTVVVRRSLTYGPYDPLTHALVEGAPGADLEAVHAPIWVDDLAAGLVSADARDRDRGAVPHLVIPLTGPADCSLGEFVALLGGQLTAGRNTSIARAQPGAPALPTHVLGLLSRNFPHDPNQPTAGTSPEVGAAAIRENLP